MLRNRILFPLLCCLLVFSMIAWAQTTGSIRGEVTDSEGKPLPGAVVTISSDALIGGTRTTYSNELGVFRFPSLPVGAYSVEIAMEGFELVQVQKVAVGLEATANVPVSMKLSTVAEQLTVIGETPVIDVTQSGLSSNFKEEMLENVPTQRNMYDLMQVAPGMSVDVGDGQSDRIVAFGSNRQSNSWNVDGVEVSGPETGSAWWTVNTDLIEEIQVLGVGASAEYGNHTGAVLNVVTKKGGNSYHGSASYFYQTDGLTDTNVELSDVSPESCCFHRDIFRNFAAQLGGPIKREKIWFFGAFEYWRDGSTQPGNDPAFTPLSHSDKYDIKVTALLGQKHEITGFGHYEDWGFPDAAFPNFTPSALSGERGTNPAWGASLTSTLSDDTLLEVSYAGWWSDDIHDSQTGSFDEPFIDYTPEVPGPTQYSGGVWYPWDYVTWREQLNGKMTYYADQFLNSQHEFKFGAQFSKGSAFTNLGIGPNGTYTYNYYGYLYQAQQDPYQYGGVSTDLGFFLDDTITVSDRLTLNLGVRFDHNTGGIPDYERLTIGQPSLSPSGNFIATGETIPGVDIVDWNLISPRLGFVLQTSETGRSVIQGSFGVYYDHNVIGNWDYPPPGFPTFRLYAFNPGTGQFDILVDETPAENIGFDPDLKAPRTLQYSLGYEHQLSDSVAAGVQYVYKDTRDLVGWEILGGVYEPFLFVDPFTGREYTLLNEVVTPTFRKGNDPGDFPGSEGLDYFQTYHGVVLTFDKRFSDRWALSASYTWSKSEGLIPRMLSQFQFNPFYGSKEGRDPNSLSINSTGRLQGDRPHMFRVQTVFQKLPWDLQFSSSMEFSTGRHYTRQYRAFELDQRPAPRIIMERGLRYSPIENIDLSIGKRINIGPDFRLRVEGWIFNLLNSGQELTFSELALNSPDETFVEDFWLQPRRFQIRFGFEF